MHGARAHGRRLPGEQQPAGEHDAAERETWDRRDENFVPGNKSRRGGGPRGPGDPTEPTEPKEPEAREDPAARARQICLRLLTFEPRTRAQLADALRRRGVPDDVADDVLARFAGVGLIDDAAFAKAWVESRHYSKGLAGRALGAELRRRGVDAGEIADALATLGADAEVDTARRLVQQKLANTRGQSADARARRVAGMLARKGYPPGLAYRLIREAMEAEGINATLVDELPDDGFDSCTE